jgi:hypothetical protein
MLERFLCVAGYEPWGRPYRAVMSTTALRVGTDGLHVDKVRSLVDELFLTRPIERRQGTSKNRNGGEEGGDNYRITEEDLIDVCRKINPNKAVSVNGIPGTAVERKKDKNTLKRAQRAALI